MIILLIFFSLAQVPRTREVREMSKLLIAVGTESALKLRAVEAAFEALSMDIEIEIQGIKAESNVPDQPFGFDKIIEGATNRAQSAMKQLPAASLGIGIESGLVEINGLWYDPPCVVVSDINSGHATASVAFGALFPIPSWVIQYIRAKDTELGHVVQKLSGGGEKDPHDYFSKKSMKREQVIEHAVLCALTPVFCPDRYMPYR